MFKHESFDLTENQMRHFTTDKAVMIKTSGLFRILNNQFSSVGAKY